VESAANRALHPFGVTSLRRFEGIGGHCEDAPQRDGGVGRVDEGNPFEQRRHDLH
jgi:hypothetical protein